MALGFRKPRAVSKTHRLERVWIFNLEPLEVIIEQKKIRLVVARAGGLTANKYRASFRGDETFGISETIVYHLVNILKSSELDN